MHKPDFAAPGKNKNEDKGQILVRSDSSPKVLTSFEILIGVGIGIGKVFYF
jgi:hypothetical protein